MNKAMLKNIVIVLLAGVAIFSISRYGLALREKYTLLDTIKQLKGRVSGLEEQQQNLLQTLGKEKETRLIISRRNLELKDNLIASRRRLSRLFCQSDQAQKELEGLSARFSVLSSESAAAQQRSMQFAQENEILKAKFNSLGELQKAIRELEAQLRKEQRPSRHSQHHRERVVYGNHGYIIKDGLPIFPAKLVIEVAPAAQPAQTQ